MATRKPPRELYQGKRKIKIGSKLKWGRSYGSVYDIDFKKKEVELDFGDDSFPLQFHELGLSELKVETDDLISVDLRAFNPGRPRKHPAKSSGRPRFIKLVVATRIPDGYRALAPDEIIKVGDYGINEVLKVWEKVREHLWLVGDKVQGLKMIRKIPKKELEDKNEGARSLSALA